MTARDETLVERMDDVGSDPERLARTYAQFARVNALLAGWSGIYRRQLRPALQAGARTVLDIGCGGGDVARHLARLAARDRLEIEILGIDPDPRAIAFAETHAPVGGVRFRCADADACEARFDFVLSNHVLHHLPTEGIPRLCAASERLAHVAVIHNDLRRSDLALALFPTVGLWFRDSYILEDGLRSIRRAFTVLELQALTPPGWSVVAAPPFRLQLRWNP